jgi:hypothetical protein
VDSAYLVRQIYRYLRTDFHVLKISSGKLTNVIFGYVETEFGIRRSVIDMAVKSANL